MILGLSLPAFTLLHVVISLVGIASGIVVLLMMIGGKRHQIWDAIFLVTTIATSVTGFLFPSSAFGAPHVFGVLSLLILAIALLALYGRHLRGPWRPAYVVSAVLALYFNVFVGVVQAFQKLPFPRSLAPTQSEPPFLIAQLTVLVVFVVLAALAVKRYHPKGA